MRGAMNLSAKDGGQQPGSRETQQSGARAPLSSW